MSSASFSSTASLPISPSSNPLDSSIIGDPFETLDDEEFVQHLDRRATRSRNDTVASASCTGSGKAKFHLSFKSKATENNKSGAGNYYSNSATLPSRTPNIQISSFAFNSPSSTDSPPLASVTSPNSVSSTISEEEEEDLDPEECENILQAASANSLPQHKQGLGLTLKKFWASKTAQSRLGRAVIVTFLGEEGNSALNALRSAIEKHKNAASAKEYFTTIIKMAIKAKLLQDERLITRLQASSLSEPLQSLSLQLYALIKPKPVKLQEVVETGEIIEAKQRAPDPAKFSAECSRFKELISNIVKLHMKQENLNKLRELFDYLGSSEFLSELCSNPRYEEEKHAIYIGLRKLIYPNLIAQKLEKEENHLCTVENCGEFNLQPSYSFRGSNKCLFHHDSAVTAFINKPTLQHFLFGDGRDYLPFINSLSVNTQRHSRKLAIALHQFTACKPAVRAVFADEIYKKYLAKNCPCRYNLPQAQLEFIETLLEAKELIHCYDELKAELFKHLDTYFSNKWCKSAALSLYISLYKLPTYLQKQLAKLKEQQKKQKK
jgi:hypothetical protein